MGGIADEFLQWGEGSRLRLGRTKNGRHEADGWLVQSRVEIAADDAEFSILPTSDPIQELDHLILARGFFHAHVDEMSYLHV